MIAQADLAACAASLKNGSRSFALASLLLPGSVRAPATALYAFCRAADDAIDLSDEGEIALSTLRARLDRIYAGRPEGAVDRAFAEVVADFALPRALPEALLDGFRWDVEGRRYEDLPGLIGYAMRVAGTVGVMMALLMERRDPAMLSAACDLGCAMQLTNIARDVGEDARAGRFYLPLGWVRAEGIEPEDWLAAPLFTPGLGRVVEALLAEADRLYARASAGIDRLPARCRPSMRAAARLYHAIGQAVRDSGCDSVSARAVVRMGRKLSVLSTCFTGAGAELAAPDRQSDFLVGTVQPASPWASARRNLPPWRQADEKIGWVVELFARLDEMERAHGSSDDTAAGRVTQA